MFEEFLETKKEGEIEELSNNRIIQKRIFKKKDKDTAGQDILEEIGYYVYTFRDWIQGNRWALDYAMAKGLLAGAGGWAESVRITSSVQDNIFLNTEKKKQHSLFIREGTRYIAEARIIFEGKTLTRTASAGADNIGIYFMSYAPEMACKRAVVRGVIDALRLPDVSTDVEFPEFAMPSQEKISDIKTEGTEKKEELVTILQKTQMGKMGIPFEEDMTKEEAGKLIEESCKLIKKVKKKGKK